MSKETNGNGAGANLPARTGEFVLANPTDFEAPDYLGQLTEEDWSAEKKESSGLPIVSIYQRQKFDEVNRPYGTIGNFCMYDFVAKERGTKIPDVDGQAGLLLTFIIDQESRVYWEKLDGGPPSCKSLDAITGVGNPGGRCSSCPLRQAKQSGEQRRCGNRKNALVYDHTIKACYIFQFTPSGISAFNAFKVEQHRKKPPVAVATRIVHMRTQLTLKPSPHYKPTFQIVGNVPRDLFFELRKLRDDLSSLERAAEAQIVDEEHPGVNDNQPGTDTQGVPF